MKHILLLGITYFFYIIGHSQGAVNYRALKAGYTVRNYKKVSESHACNIPISFFYDQTATKGGFYIGTQKEQLFTVVSGPTYAHLGGIQLNMFGVLDMKNKLCCLWFELYDHPKEFIGRLSIYYPNPSSTQESYYYMLIKDEK